MKISKEAKLFTIQEAVKLLTRISVEPIMPVANLQYGWTGLFAVKHGDSELHIIQHGTRAAILEIEKSTYSETQKFVNEKRFEEIFVIES